MPLEIIEQIVEALNEAYCSKIESHGKQFDELTKEQKTVTKMMDNLYLDKLKGRITESEYDKFYQTFRDQMAEVTIRLEALQEADDNYHTTTKHLLNLTSKAYDLFLSSEVEEKRQLIRLVLSNLCLKGEKLVYDAHKPFDLILNCSDYQIWCA